MERFAFTGFKYLWSWFLFAQNIPQETLLQAAPLTPSLRPRSQVPLRPRRPIPLRGHLCRRCPSRRGQGRPDHQPRPHWRFVPLLKGAGLRAAGVQDLKSGFAGHRAFAARLGDFLREFLEMKGILEDSVLETLKRGTMTLLVMYRVNFYVIFYIYKGVNSAFDSILKLNVIGILTLIIK